MNLLKLWILSEPTVMSSEPTRGNVYCCNTELHCTQCNNCNQTMSVGLLKCRTYQETTTVLSRQAFTTMSPTTNNPQTVDGECQYLANTTVTFHVFFLLLRQLQQWSPISVSHVTVSANTYTEQIQHVISKLSGTVNTVLGATVGVLLVLLLVTVVALVNTCVALRMKNKQRYVWYAP